ncbi:MAG: transposase [Verrucomicrobiae bacterium]|nr:transposase [Verrucomicrobiae bacterium]
MTSPSAPRALGGYEAAIDWSRGFLFMDKELQALVPDARSTRQYVDKLVKLWRKDGQPQWVLIHVEIQSQFIARLAERIFRYHCRLREAYDEPVVSLVVLADENPRWRPQSYQFDLWGCLVHFQFPACKLLDLSETTLDEASQTNPVALLVLAHRAAQRTRRDPQGRRVRKWELIRQMYERGWEKKDVLELYRLLDWLLRLPAEEERVVQQQVLELEKEKRMPYISSAERFGIEKGLKRRGCRPVPGRRYWKC